MFVKIKEFFKDNPEAAFAGIAGVLGVGLVGALTAVVPWLARFVAGISPITALIGAAAGAFAYFYANKRRLP